jgi:hypothetical protein
LGYYIKWIRIKWFLLRFFGTFRARAGLLEKISVTTSEGADENPGTKVKVAATKTFSSTYFPFFNSAHIASN